MSALEVKTNWVPRELLMLDEIPEKAQADFDYIEGDDRYQSRIVKYKGGYYDIYDTQYISVGERRHPLGWDWNVEPTHPFVGWDCVMSDSFSSGMLFKVTLDDRVVVGQFFS